MSTLITPRQAVAAERIAAATNLNEVLLNIELGKMDSLDLELAEARVYRAGIAKVLVSVVIEGDKFSVTGLSKSGANTMLSLNAGERTLQVMASKVDATTFEFEDFDAAPAVVVEPIAVSGVKTATVTGRYEEDAQDNAAGYAATLGSALVLVAINVEQTGTNWTATITYRDATPAEAYAAKHNGSLYGYNGSANKTTRRQLRNAAIAGIMAGRRYRFDMEREAQEAARVHSAGQPDQAVALPGLPTPAYYRVKNVAVLKALLANHSYPARRIVAQLLTRTAATNKPERRATVEVVQYFKRFIAANSLN